MNRHGILLLDKPAGRTSFSLVAELRRLSQVQKIGHAGTLDPFATGVMVMLLGRAYTKCADLFLQCDKEYCAELHLGIATNTYDVEGEVTLRSSQVPTLEEVERVVGQFQGSMQQVPPMFSAKKRQGKKLYELARQNIEVERAACPIELTTHLLSYTYPLLKLQIACSKGTYIRSIAQEMGSMLGCGAHLSQLTRLRSGPFRLEDCIALSQIKDLCTLQNRLIRSLPTALLPSA